MFLLQRFNFRAWTARCFRALETSFDIFAGLFLTSSRKRLRPGFNRKRLHPDLQLLEKKPNRIMCVYRDMLVGELLKKASRTCTDLLELFAGLFDADNQRSVQ